MNWDIAWYLTINRAARATPWLHGAMAAYALWAGLTLLAAMLVAAWWASRRRADAPIAVATTALTGISAVAALLINQNVLSPLIGRARPCATLPHVQVLLPCSADYSMPSDHCILAGAFLVGLWFIGRWWGAVATALSVILAFGRVYAGVHYPSDVAAGLAIGAAICLVVQLLARRPVARVAHRLESTPLAPLIRARGMAANPAPPPDAKRD